MWGHNGAVCFNYRDIKIPTTKLWWTLEILPHGHNLSYLTKSVPVLSEILLQVPFEKSKCNVRASPVVVISRVNLVVEKGHHLTLHGWEVLSTEEFLLELLATAGPAFTWHQILAGSWVRRSGGYSSFVFIVQEVGGGGWCAISSSQLKCIGCSDSATKTWDDEKIFPSHEAAETCVGRLIGQSDIYLMGSARPDWPADLNWILCSERERERSDTDRQTGPWYLLSLTECNLSYNLIYRQM